MLGNRIRFISAQPDQLHFVWQTYVYLQNYLSLGLPAPNCVALFGALPGEPLQKMGVAKVVGSEAKPLPPSLHTARTADLRGFRCRKGLHEM